MDKIGLRSETNFVSRKLKSEPRIWPDYLSGVKIILEQSCIFSGEICRHECGNGWWDCTNWSPRVGSRPRPFFLRSNISTICTFKLENSNLEWNNISTIIVSAHVRCIILIWSGTTSLPFLMQYLDHFLIPLLFGIGKFETGLTLFSSEAGLS